MSSGSVLLVTRVQTFQRTFFLYHAMYTTPPANTWSWRRNRDYNEGLGEDNIRYSQTITPNTVVRTASRAPLAPPPPYPPKPVDGPTGVDGSSPETASFCLLWLTRSSGVFWCRSVGRGECGPLVVRNLRVGMSRGRVAHAAFDAVRVRVRGARCTTVSIRKKICNDSYRTG